MQGSAIISSCGVWRYRLDRGLGGRGPSVAIIGVNPSTATADTDDQTIRRELGFGQRLGWRRLIKGNKFAFRATDVDRLAVVADAVGPENDRYLEQIFRDADLHIVAWGRLSKLPAPLRARWKAIVALSDSLGCELMCWDVGKDKHPRHPLRLPYTTKLVPWRMPD